MIANKQCFICEKTLTSNRAVNGKTITCSTNCGVMLREINIRGKVFACEIQSFIDWSIGLKTNVKPFNCKDCNKNLGLRKPTARIRFCNDCASVRTKANIKQNHKTKMSNDTDYKRKNIATKARARHKRRTLQAYGDVIDLYELAERDHWQCKLCDKPIDKNAKHYKGNLNLYGPSLDHIIPVSLGGTHTWNNVQLAHYYCNSIRGNKPIAQI